MPQDNDRIKTTVIYQVGGVTCRNDLYWIIDNVGTLSLLSEIALLVQNKFRGASETICSTEMAYIATFADNLSRNEPRGAATSVLFGLNLGSAHPPDQVLRWNEYGQNGPSLPMHVGGFNLSGIAESLSTDGSFNDFGQLAAMTSFLLQEIEETPLAFTMTPHVQVVVSPGPPATFGYHQMKRVRPNSVFRKLKSRKTNLLGI